MIKKPIKSGKITQIDRARRFSFGKNWQKYIDQLTDQQIERATSSLTHRLGRSLKDKTFLDIGSGSGLFSLAARRLGARVTSFDYDYQSVASTRALKEQYYPDDQHWTISQGSILDQHYLKSLGTFNIVYAWGVLHHSGSLWQAIENTASLVIDSGLIYLALYNDQGRASRQWLRVKQVYNYLPATWRFLVLGPASIYLWGGHFLTDFLKGQPGKTWRNYGVERGMSPWRDVVDWVGGYPFEVAKPDLVFNFFKERGFEMLEFNFCNGHGCNEYVFRESNKSIFDKGAK